MNEKNRGPSRMNWNEKWVDWSSRKKVRRRKTLKVQRRTKKKSVKSQRTEIAVQQTLHTQTHTPKHSYEWTSKRRAKAEWTIKMRNAIQSDRQVSSLQWRRGRKTFFFGSFYSKIKKKKHVKTGAKPAKRSSAKQKKWIKWTERLFRNEENQSGRGAQSEREKMK